MQASPGQSEVNAASSASSEPVVESGQAVIQTSPSWTIIGESYEWEAGGLHKMVDTIEKTLRSWIGDDIADFRSRLGRNG